MDLSGQGPHWDLAKFVMLRGDGCGKGNVLKVSLSRIKNNLMNPLEQSIV